MAIDIRATVTCSLGTLISGSISDDYLQGSGLIKTRGSVEISGTITPAIGTVVTFSYVKDGITRSVPRKLRVLSSFADPFRRTTKVELGCKLTYLSDLKDPIKWDAFDDPENAALTEEDAEIITIPIRASSVMNECLTKLGITASSNPLTNQFSIPEFDFGSGYVQTLNDLLVSESYFGYLDTSEVLQVRNLTTETGTGPVFTASNIVDLGPIGVGQLPGEAVTVSYSTLKLRNSEAEEGPDNEIPNSPSLSAEARWEFTESIGAATQVSLQFPAPIGIRSYLYFPYSAITSTYENINGQDQLVEQREISNSIAGADYGTYLVNVFTAGIPAVNPGAVTQSEVITTYSYGVNTRTIVKQEFEPYAKAAGGMSVPFAFSAGDYVILPTTTIATAITRSEVRIVGSVTQTKTTFYRLWHLTIEGQQAIAEGRANFNNSTEVAAYINSIVNQGPVYAGTEISTQYTASLPPDRPSTADLINQSLAEESDGTSYRTESVAEIELAVGSAAAQRRIELSMPYAPDDRFVKSGTDYYAISSDAPAKANRYGRVQNRLLLGNRNGMNLQLSPERLPAAPFDPLYVQANGLTGLYRANGTSWAFDSNGIVASVDALFWAAIGGTGSAFWFPVAPGVTTLPTTPPVVDGAMNATTVVLPYNETAVYTSRVRLLTSVTKFDYSLTLLTTVPASVVKIKTDVRRILKVEPPAAALTLAAQTPTVSGGGSAKVPVTATALAAIAPAVSGGGSVAAPAGMVTIAGLNPEQAGKQITQVFAPSSNTTISASIPAASSGASIAAPNKDVGIAAAIPSVFVFDADAATYIAAVQAADGQSLEADVKTAINNFVVGCKADGIWTAIKASCILAGARTLSGALVPLVGTAPTNNNFVSGDYNRETGLAGNGSTKYLDSNRNNNADPQNSVHGGVYVTVMGTNTQALLGCGAGGTTGTNQILHVSGSGFQSRIRGSAANFTVTAGGDVAGFNGITRTGATSAAHRSNNTNTSITYASSTPLSENIRVFARGADAPLYSNARLAFYSIGESLDLALLDTRVTALINAIAAAIP